MEASSTLARGLSDLALGAGDTFAAFLRISVEWAILLWSCARLGVAFAPINPAFLERPDDLRHILRVLLPKDVLCLGSGFAKHVDAACDEIPRASATVRIALRKESPLRHGWMLFEEIARCTEPLESSPHAATSVRDVSTSIAEQAAMVLLTSGTTSLPKACPYTAHNLHAQSIAFQHIRQMRPHHECLILGPLFHIQSVWNTLMAWRAGAAICLPCSSYDAAGAIKGIGLATCSHMSCGPSMIRAMITHPDSSERGYAHIKALALGSDIISHGLIVDSQQAFRAQKVFAGWGMTETIGCISLSTEQTMLWHDGTPNFGFVTPGNAARICRPAGRELVRRGELGELHVSGAAVIRGYMEGVRLKHDDSFYTKGGRDWFVTGDLSVMDEVGSIYIKGRTKDMVIRGGENLIPAAMEDLLNGIEGIKVRYSS